MSDVLAGSISSGRFNMLVLTVFSGLALVLAAVGVHGLIACAVAQRTREIGMACRLTRGRHKWSMRFWRRGCGCVWPGLLSAWWCVLLGAVSAHPFVRHHRVRRSYNPCRCR